VKKNKNKWKSRRESYNERNEVDGLDLVWMVHNKI